MKNRYIPFGYQIQNGDSVINTEQAATVQHIFYAYTEGQSFKEIAEYLTTSGTAYHFSDNSWNKNIVARILANEIYCGAKGYPAIISKEVYSQAASIRSNKTVTYSAVLKPFRSDMQCACCGERLYWRPRTQQWTCRQCGMWSKPMQPENMAQQIVDRLYQIQQHPEIIHNPKEQCNTRSIEVAQLDHEIHTALALPELDADAIIDKILRRAELQFNYCAAGDDDPTTMQIKRACKEFKPTDTFPESFYSSMLGYGKSSANRIAQYEMGYRSPKANRLKEIAKAMNIREEIFLMPDETPIDLLRILIWYDWEHEGVLQLATSRTANTPPGKTVSPIIYSEQLPLNRLLLDWADQKHSLSVRKITRADYLEWMLQWPPRLP